MTKPFKLMRKSMFSHITGKDALELDSFDTYEEAAEDYLARLDEWMANVDAHADEEMIPVASVVRTFKKQYYIEGPKQSMVGVDYDPAQHEADMQLALRYEDGEAVNC